MGNSEVRSRYKKDIWLILVVLVCFSLFGCTNSQLDNENTANELSHHTEADYDGQIIEENPNSTTDNILAKESELENNKEIDYQYIYMADCENTSAINGSSLSIAKNNEGYKFHLDLIRLAHIYGEIIHLDSINGIAMFTATDPCGKPIAGKITRNPSGDIELKFTNSTWNYLPDGTTFLFKDNNESIKDKGGTKRGLCQTRYYN